MPQRITNSYAQLFLKEGIVHCMYRARNPFDLKGAMTVVRDRLKLQNGMFYPVLTDLSNLNTVTREARAYMASEGLVLITAIAFVSHHPVGDMNYAMFSQLHLTTIPFQLFQNQEAALQYLRPYTS